MNHKKIINTLNKSINKTFSEFLAMDIDHTDVVTFIKYIDNYETVSFIEFDTEKKGFLGIAVQSSVLQNRHIGQFIGARTNFEAMNNLLGEFTNVIAGNLLSEIGNKNKLFEISTPKYTTISKCNQELSNCKNKIVVECSTTEGSVYAYYAELDD